MFWRHIPRLPGQPELECRAVVRLGFRLCAMSSESSADPTICAVSSRAQPSSIATSRWWGWRSLLDIIADFFDPVLGWLVVLLVTPFTGPMFLYRYQAHLTWWESVLAGLTTGSCFWALIILLLTGKRRKQLVGWMRSRLPRPTQ